VLWCGYREKRFNVYLAPDNNEGSLKEVRSE